MYTNLEQKRSNYIDPIYMDLMEHHRFPLLSRCHNRRHNPCRSLQSVTFARTFACDRELDCDRVIARLGTRKRPKSVLAFNSTILVSVLGFREWLPPRMRSKQLFLVVKRGAVVAKVYNYLYLTLSPKTHGIVIRNILTSLHLSELRGQSSSRYQHGILGKTLIATLRHCFSHTLALPFTFNANFLVSYLPWMITFFHPNSRSMVNEGVLSTLEVTTYFDDFR